MFSFLKKNQKQRTIDHVHDTALFFMWVALHADRYSECAQNAQKRNTVFTFAYGAIDALAQHCGLSEEDTEKAMKRFFDDIPIKSPSGDTKDLISMLSVTVFHPDWLPICQSGGRSMIGFVTTSPLAPKDLEKHL